MAVLGTLGCLYKPYLMYTSIKKLCLPSRKTVNRKFDMVDKIVDILLE